MKSSRGKKDSPAEQITEESIFLSIPTGKLTRKLPVFYNPIMKLNRDISVLLANALPHIKRAADVLAGSGVRALRFLKETHVKEVVANDASPTAVASIKQHAKKNKVTPEIHNMDASAFLLSQKAFDYIDVDPFGSPNPFLDAAIKRLKKQGVLALAATDTSALTGTHPKAGMRKYWGRGMRNWLMHEVGIRLLIRKVQLIGAQYDKALEPIFVHHTKHYYRVYLQCNPGKQKVDAVLKQHGMISVTKELEIEHGTDAGPLWLGPLWDAALVKKMVKPAEGDAKELLERILEEATIPVVGFHDIHEHCSALRKSIPPYPKIHEALVKKKKPFGRTHFSPQGIRTTMSAKEFRAILKKL